MLFLAIALILGAILAIAGDGRLWAFLNPAGAGDPGGGQTTTRAARNASLTDLGNSYIDGGLATTSVGGAFSLSGQQIQADTLRSYIQDGTAWLGFGGVSGGTGAAEILVTLNESGQDTVSIAQGDLAAIGQDDDCEWNIQVSESSVSGTISCTAVEVWRNTTERTGTTASIQLQFSTALTPMEGDEPGGGEGGEPDDTPPAD